MEKGMDVRLVISLILMMLVIVYIVGSARIILEGDEALVIRLGKYQRTLKPGLHFVIPFLDIVLFEAMREQVLDCPPERFPTNDGSLIGMDFIVYWQIKNLRQAYYAVEDVETSILSLIISIFGDEIGRRKASDVMCHQNEISKLTKDRSNQTTLNWGIQITYIAIQRIEPLESVLKQNSTKTKEDKLRVERFETSEFQKSHEASILQRLNSRVTTPQELSKELTISPSHLNPIISELRKNGYLQTADVVIKPESYLLITTKGISYLQQISSESIGG
jgi:regulator of protease activity HflC (stomatin/prohibitin superfamily)